MLLFGNYIYRKCSCCWDIIDKNSAKLIWNYLLDLLLWMTFYISIEDGKSIYTALANIRAKRKNNAHSNVDGAVSKLVLYIIRSDKF